MDGGEGAALSALVWKVFTDDRTWICDHCGGESSILTEVCEKCGTEDCQQGTEVIP